MQPAAGRARIADFELNKRGQLFIRVLNESPSVIAVCVCNPDRSPAGINR
jgi:hypothetical protein